MSTQKDTNKIVGYGLCGPNEPYLENTLKEFKRLCDETIILANKAGEKELELIRKYGFRVVEDRREWGVLQWKIKEDFVRNFVSKTHADLYICLDMDEVFIPQFTREEAEKLIKSPWKSFYFFFIDLWDEGFNPALNFENIRAWKPGMQNVWKRTPVHCGLAPEWTYYHGYRTQFIVEHYGLKDKERREQKRERYDQYDPNRKYLTKHYYDLLLKEVPATENKREEEFKKRIAFISKYRQTKPPMSNEKEEMAEIRLPNGSSATIRKKDWPRYANRPGHEYIKDHVELNEELDQLLEENKPPVVEEPSASPETITLDEPVVETQERFICGKCGWKGDSKRALNAHNLGAHNPWWKKK
jgi:hypothetical protein